MHESRHRHAVKRSRGYSGRFCGKDGHQQSPDPPVSGSLPPPPALPLIRPPPSFNTVHSTTTPSISIRDVVCDVTTSIRDVVSGGCGSQYQTVLGDAPTLRGLNVVPEITPASEEDALPVTSINTHSASLTLNQPGVTQQLSSTDSLLPSVSPCAQEDSESIGDATIQGLINAAQTFSVPILPPP